MATINYKCPHCKAALETEAKLAGQSEDCPACGGRCNVPVKKPIKAVWIWSAIAIIIGVIAGIGIFVFPKNQATTDAPAFKQPTAVVTSSTPTVTAPIIKTLPKPAIAKGDPKFAGFRGIRWGTDLTQMSDMTFFSDQDYTHSVNLDNNNSSDIHKINMKDYHRNGDKLSFGTIPVDSITYKAFNDKYYEVDIECLGSFFEVLSLFTSNYGEPFKGDKSYMWNGISPDGDDVQVFMMLEYSCAKITNMRIEAQLTAEAAKQDEEKLKKAKQSF